MDKQQRFMLSKCDRCGKATATKSQDGADLYTLPHEFVSPLAGQGNFCQPCLDRFDEADWLAWFRLHRPELWESK